LSFLSNIFGHKAQRAKLEPLYGATIAAGRDPAWYREGEVPDTVDGRFDVIAALFTLLLLRLEHDGDAAHKQSVLLAELFIEDMEGSIRQLGTGDLMVGKRVGKMMGALGGGLTVFRQALEGDGDFDAVVVRNVFHEAPPSDAAVGFVSGRLRRFHDGLAALPTAEILAGTVPAS